MSILVCAATEMELATWPAPGDPWQPVVTGVGPLASILSLADIEPFDAIVSIGIAGAYRDRGLAIGDVVLAESEVQGDLGMELPTTDRFLPLSETPFGGDDARRVTLAVPEVLRGRFPVVPACTVAQCTGTDATGRFRRDRFDVSIETMEGVAVAAFASRRGLPCVGIRAISNFAADRDMRPENIRLALDSLGTALATVAPALAGVPVARW